MKEINSGKGDDERGKEQKRNTLPVMETPLKGVFLLHKPGVIPDMSPEIMERYIRAAREYVSLYPELQILINDMKQPKENLTKITGEIEGLRGVEEKGNFRQSVSISETEIFDREKMLEGAGEHYGEVVMGEELSFSLNLDPNMKTNFEIFKGALAIVMDYLGYPVEEINTRIAMSSSVTVNRKELERQLDNGNIKLPEGTVTVKRGSPTVNQPIIYPKPENGRQTSHS